MKLYDYVRSTASWRVRIALALKGLDAECIPVHLLQDGGQQHFAEYQALNPQKLVPTLMLEDGRLLTQSLAIIEYLDEEYPHPPLLPEDTFERAKVRQMAQIIACDIHPLNNLRILNQLRQQFQADDDAIHTWYHHWLKQGFDALETMLQAHHMPFCHGQQPSLADIALVPQIFNARRFQFDMTPYTRIIDIEKNCLKRDAFKQTAPQQ